MIDHSNGFASISDLSLNGNGISNTSNILQLTDAMNGEASSAFGNTPQGVDTFDTTFDFTYGTTAPPNADGFTFTIQNSAAGATAVGGGGGGLGYAGLGTSVGIKFDIYPNEDQTGVYLNGAGITDSAQPPSTTPVGNGVNIDLTKKTDGTASGIDFHANPGDDYHVHLVYDGTTLTETVTDVTNNNATVTQQYTVNIPAAVNDHTAFVGFTAATGGLNAEQDITKWKFTGTQTATGLVPLPAPVLSGSPSLPGEALLNWSNVTGNETGFEIDRADAAGGAFAMVTMVPTGTTTFTDMGLSTTKSYKYEIKALGDNVKNTDSPLSNVVTISGAGLQTVPINHANGFAGATDLQLNGTALITGASASVPNALQLTAGAMGGNEDGSAFDKNLQFVNKFDTTFDFTFGGTTPPGADGFTFAIQTGPLTARGGGGGGLGYSGLANSVGVKFDLYDGSAGPTVSTTGVFTNGAVNDGNTPIDSAMPAALNSSIDLTVDAAGKMTGIDFHANPSDDYKVHLVYDGTTLTETVTDVTKTITVSQAYTIDIPGMIGDVAEVGFTGADGGAIAEQDITSWTFPTAVVNKRLPADFNNDGKVDFSDLLILAQNYGKTGQTQNTGDTNGDGKVDFTDLLTLAQEYGKTSTGTAAKAGTALASVVDLVKTR